MRFETTALKALVKLIVPHDADNMQMLCAGVEWKEKF